jgi:hypothetical protein
MSDIRALPKNESLVEIEVEGEDDNGTQVSGSTEVPYIPSNVFKGAEQQASFMEWITSEILDVRDGDERKQKEESWIEQRRIRRGRRQTKTRDTPWINAANVESTLAAQKVNAIYAKEVAAFATRKPPVRVSAADPAMLDKARSLENLLNYMARSRYGMNMPVVQNQLFYDQVSLGAAIVKVPFLVEQMTFKRTNASGTEDVNYVRHRGPATVPIRLEDFFTRPYWKDLQRAPWVAVRYRMFEHELRQKAALGFFDEKELEKVFAVPLTKYDDGREADLENSRITAGSLGRTARNSEFDIYEVNAFFDVDGDGYAEDVIAWVEPETNTLLRSEFNPLSIRDYEVIPYLEDPESFYAIGICELVQDLQDEATALKRMRLDGTKLAMLKMFISRTGCGIEPNETFEPFKHFQLDDPNADFREINFPDIAPSCLAGEELTKQEADRVTGANDYMTGFNDKVVGSGASVGGTMFLAQQGNSILNSILARAEQSIGNIYMIALYQCMANKDKLDLSFLSPEDQANVREILAYNVEDIPTQFRFTVQVTDISKTDEAKKQETLIASQLYAAYGQQVLQLMGMIPSGAQNAPVIAQKLAVGGTEMVSRILEKAGIEDPQTFLPYMGDLELQLQAIEQAKVAQVQQAKGQVNGGQGQGFVGQGGVGGQAAPMAGGGGFGAPGFGPTPGAGPAQPDLG